MKRKYAVIAIIFAVSMLIGIQAFEVADANPVPFTQTPNLERPSLTITAPQNYSTYNTPNIPLNLTVKQPDSWNATHWLWHYVGEVNSVDVSVDGNISAHYSAYQIVKYSNGNKTTTYPNDPRDPFSVVSICDWINQTTPGMHTLNITVISHTYSLSHYPGSNEKAGAMYDGQPIYEYPIIVSDIVYFTVEQPTPSQSMPTINTGPTLPVELNPPVAYIILTIVIVIVAVASISLVYFRRIKNKLASTQSFL
jgi:hypothetical protein